jgi:two-component system sensor histidine kinase MtrB
MFTVARWRQSLAWRVTGSIVLLSIMIISLIGTALNSRLTDGIFKEKLNTSLADARDTAQSVDIQLTIAQYQSAAVTKKMVADIFQVPPTVGDQSGREVALFPIQTTGSSEPNYQGVSNLLSPASIPNSFRASVRKSQKQLWQRTNLDYLNGRHIPGIVVGNIVRIPTVGNYEFYVLFSLSDQRQTFALISQTLWVAGIALILMVGLITLLVIRQITSPIREAAQIAERLTDGDLDQRMQVVGENEISRLGVAFNEMAVALKQQISRLENLSRLQQRFVSDVSHELRTPLTTLRMAAQVIYSSRTNFDPTVARSAELLFAQIERFETLLSDLLEVSRFDAEAAVLELEEIDLIALVNRTVDYVNPSQERIITVHAPNEPVVVAADSRRIERVLRNLITNAIDHREDKGIDIYIAENDESTAVAVRDYGVGFAPRDSQRLFERFWRADPSRARVRGGTGLGLSIAMEDAKLHQGRLEAWGNLGRGSQFVLTLPKRPGVDISTSPIEVIPSDEARSII